MKNHSLIVGFLVIALILIGGAVVLAGKPDLTPQLTTVNSPGGQATVVIPQNAVEVAPGIFSLGTAIDQGQVVEGYAFIDYKKGFAKPGTECGNGICEQGENAKKCPADCTGNGGNGDDTSCFQFIAKGARWKVTEPYVLDTTNSDGMTADFVASKTATSMETWDTEVTFDIFGARDTSATVDGADTSSPDGKNEIFFGNISEPGVIAVTIVWGIFSAPPPFNKLIEYDMVFDDADFDFGDAGPTSETSLGDTSVMDFQNITTHELGHALGLAHPEDTCTEQTMYRFAAFGETQKRTLGVGDIKGVQQLYK